jgi:hypothetical protein
MKPTKTESGECKRSAETEGAFYTHLLRAEMLKVTRSESFDDARRGIIHRELFAENPHEHDA